MKKKIRTPKITNFGNLRKAVSEHRNQLAEQESVINGMNAFRGAQLSDIAVAALYTCVDLEALDRDNFHLAISCLNNNIHQTGDNQSIINCAKEIGNLKRKLLNLQETARNLLSIAASSEANRLGLSAGGGAPAYMSDFPAQIQFSSVSGSWTYAFLSQNAKGPQGTLKQPEYGLFYVYEFSNAKIDAKLVEGMEIPKPPRVAKKDQVNFVSIYEAERLNTIATPPTDTRTAAATFHRTAWFQFTNKKLNHNKHSGFTISIGESSEIETVAPPMTIWVHDTHSPYSPKNKASVAELIHAARRMDFAIKPSTQQRFQYLSHRSNKSGMSTV